jgi:hypothetical protein
LPKPDEKTVKQVLAKRGRDAKIFEAIQHGWKTVKADPNQGWWRRKTTHAENRWENAVDKLIELLADDPGAQVIDHHGTVSFILDDKVLVRVKKASVSLHTSNIRTVLADLFHKHQADLFGHEGLQRVEAVYVLNQFETEIIWTGIVARQNNEILWKLELGPKSAPVAMLPASKPATTGTAKLAKLKADGIQSDKKKKK